MRDTISGYEAVDYIVRVMAGQRLAATLRASNPSSYLNIKARGSSEALFNGSIEGNVGDVIVPSGGDYVVEVYLMRNAARRGESANFSLTVEVTGGDPGNRQPDFADGLSGGPDFWEVANVQPGDRLNVRARPSSQATTVARLRNGTVLRNLGCRMNGQTRWCRVERRDGSAGGWAAGRFLVESGG
ncbi:SH3 domain-containing protein [Aminobacter carboxidus]|uniref:SH3 domain-containing protein n=1 Tax=Aminobacter carboxidus TaxID=376165 RepID=UPI0031B59426